MQVKTTVIVKSYQRPWLLRVCLESLRQMLHGSYRIVVADDGTDPELWREVTRRLSHLFDDVVWNERGTAKWPLCRRGAFRSVVPTCGATWNGASRAAHGETIFLIEDDSYMIRETDADECAALLRHHPEALCLIGLQERCNMESGTASVIGDGERFALRSGGLWPWSFDGIFYRQSVHDAMGPWPEGAPTGIMEQWVRWRLHLAGLYEMQCGFALAPFCRFDASCSVRTDHPSTYAGRFRHVDAVNAAWLAGEFDPSFEDVRAGRLPWDRTRTAGPMRLHYRRDLRQINFVTGHELCGDLAGEAADASWLSQANQEAARYGEQAYESVPEACRSGSICPGG